MTPVRVYVNAERDVTNFLPNHHLVGPGRGQDQAQGHGQEVHTIASHHSNVVQKGVQRHHHSC